MIKLQIPNPNSQKNPKQRNPKTSDGRMKQPSFNIVAAVAMALVGAAGARGQPLAIRTLAGGATVGAANGFGSNARFSHPNGIAADSAGNIYVADTENSTVRKI